MAEWVYGRGISREEITRHLELILELRDSTSSVGGQSSTENKNQSALKAIKLFSYVAVGAAGWAFNHAAGRALDPDAHEDEDIHETRGDNILDRDFVRRRERTRPALAELLRCLDGILPGSTAELLSRAIIALNKREVHPIVRPIKGYHRKNSDSLWNRRLEAVSWWHYLNALGEAESLTKVHEAFGYPHSTKTVPKWRERLRKTDQKRLEAAISAAEQAGYFMALPEAERITCELSSSAKRWLDRSKKVPLWEAGRRYIKNMTGEDVDSA